MYQKNKILSLPSGSDILRYIWTCQASAIYDIPINWRYIHKRCPAPVQVLFSGGTLFNVQLNLISKHLDGTFSRATSPCRSTPLFSRCNQCFPLPNTGGGKGLMFKLKAGFHPTLHIDQPKKMQLKNNYPASLTTAWSPCSRSAIWIL